MKTVPESTLVLYRQFLEHIKSRQPSYGGRPSCSCHAFRSGDFCKEGSRLWSEMVEKSYVELTTQGEGLQNLCQRPEDWEASRVTGASHRFCWGLVVMKKVTPKYFAIYCAACGLRVMVSREVSTISDLRIWSAAYLEEVRRGVATEDAMEMATADLLHIRGDLASGPALAAGGEREDREPAEPDQG